MFPDLVMVGNQGRCGVDLYSNVWRRARDHMVLCILGNLIGIGWGNNEQTK